MPSLIVAEKPSVAQDIARVLGARSRGQGFVQGNGWVITWCVGHLVELDEPHSYHESWRKWSLDSLPMLPDHFRLRPSERTRDQYEVVSHLLTRADITDVVNACDAGREGELIFRYVYTLAGSHLPIRRLWISSMTEEAIQAGFNKLADGQKFDRLWDAARCRSEADWLVGLNATRALTVRTRQVAGGSSELFSVGRVQTPTLALLVRREKEIRNFVPKDYFQLLAHFDSPAGAYTGKWFKGKQDRFDVESEARAIQEKVEGKTGRVVSVDKKKTTEKPPLLFDLTRLQRTANKRYGFSAAQTLEIAQRLYEQAKIITYPRTDSSHLSHDLVGQMEPTLNAVAVGEYTQFARVLLDDLPIPTPKRIFDDSKVSDHHAIIPTPRRPNLDRLSTEERRLYDLIVRRFIGAFYPDAEFEKTRVVTEVEEETFVSHGKVVLKPGWREVAGWKDDEGAKPKKKDNEGEGEEEDEDQGLLPQLKRQDPATARQVELQAKKTQPPARYTEATLLAAMEGAGKLLDDDELQQAMKDCGLGTPATRASIIETLLQRSYVERKGKALVPLEKGILLIDAIPVESLTSPELTGEWEARLARMSRSQESVEQFQADVRQYVEELVGKVKGAPLTALAAAMVARPVVPPPAPEEGSRKKKKKLAAGAVGICPRCTGAVMVDGRTFSCRGEEGKGESCGFRVWREVAGRTLTEDEGRLLLGEGRVGPLAGFKSKAGKDFEASLILNQDGRVTFDFARVARVEVPPPAPAEESPTAKKPRRSRKSAEVSPADGSVSPRNEPPADMTPTPPPPRKEIAPALPVSSTSWEPEPWTCPICQRGQMIRGKEAWGCSRWRENCRVVIPFEVEGRKLMEVEARKLTLEGRLGPVMGFKSPRAPSGWGVLVLEPTPTGGAIRLMGAGG